MTWSDVAVSSRSHHAFALDVLELLELGPNSSVLELGSGEGRFANALSVFVDAVVTVDPVEAISRTTVVHHQMRAEDFRYPRMGYDAVIAIESLHLFDDKLNIMRRAIHSLKPGGRMMICWIEPPWEELLRGRIVSALDRIGVDMSDWGYWRCESMFNDRGARSIADVTAPAIVHRAEEEWTAGRLVDVLLCIDRVALALAAAGGARAVAAALLDYLGLDEGWKFVGPTAYWARIVTPRV